MTLCRQQNIDQIVVDPSLHNEKSSPLFFAVESRDTPDAFKIFVGKSTFKLETYKCFLSILQIYYIMKQFDH